MAPVWLPPADIHAYPQHERPAIIREAPASPYLLDLKDKFPVLYVQATVCGKVGVITQEAQKQAICNETAQKLEWVIPSEAEKKAFLDKMYATINDKGAVFRKALENHTVQIFEVPWEDLYGVSMDGKNLDYLYKKNGEFFFGFYKRRIDERYWIFLYTLQRIDLTEKHLETGEYILYRTKDNKPIPTFSPDYFKGIMFAVRETIEDDNFIKWLQKKD